MKPSSAIEVASPCAGWRRACPAVRRLARDAARVALAHAGAALEFAPPARVELGITLADDAGLRRLNRDYRGRDMPTNVLAFPAWEPGKRAPPSARLLLGDVVLGFETVVREAAEQGKPLADHLRHLIVHGVLHLLGYDHRTEADAVTMEALETSVLATLGVPDPYRDTMWSLEPEPISDERFRAART
jgi:probable rRNA maturation factor